MKVGSYTLGRELGRGGMGVVFHAKDAAGRDVAIKTLIAASAAARERFARERRLMTTLSLVEGFVPILDSGDDPRGAWFVMPLMTGGTLREKLRRGPLPIDAVISLAEALGAALAAAHGRGLVHRDLKPENVLFDGRGRALVADLGLAKHFSDDATGASQSVSITRSGQVAGTAGYMAPEQALDARKAGPAADVFAIGAILYECLAGWPAFEGRTVLELLEKIATAHAAPVSNARPETPVWLANLVERALARDAGQRFADGAALLAAVKAKAATAPRREMSLAARSALRAALVGGGLFALVVGALSFALRPAAVVSREDSLGGGQHLARENDDIGDAIGRFGRTADVTSADAPAALLLAGDSPRAHELLELAAARLVVYGLEDAARVRLRHPGPAAEVLEALAKIVHGGAHERADGLAVLERSPAFRYRVAHVFRRAEELRALCTGESLGAVDASAPPTLASLLDEAVVGLPVELGDAALAPLTALLWSDQSYFLLLPSDLEHLVERRRSFPPRFAVALLYRHAAYFEDDTVGDLVKRRDALIPSLDEASRTPGIAPEHSALLEVVRAHLDARASGSRFEDCVPALTRLVEQLPADRRARPAAVLAAARTRTFVDGLRERLDEPSADELAAIIPAALLWQEAETHHDQFTADRSLALIRLEARSHEWRKVSSPELEAEHLRLEGRPDEAFAVLAKATSPEVRWPERPAIEALICADLGWLDEAWNAARAAPESAALPRWRRKRVIAYIEAKTKSR